MTATNFLGIDRSKEYIKVQSGALTVQLLVVVLAIYMLFTVKGRCCITPV